MLKYKKFSEAFSVRLPFFLWMIITLGGKGSFKNEQREQKRSWQSHFLFFCTKKFIYVLILNKKKKKRELKSEKKEKKILQLLLRIPLLRMGNDDSFSSSFSLFF